MKNRSGIGKATILGGLAAACGMLACVTVQGQVINYDTPGVYGTDYSGQGAYSDPGNNFWNAIPSSGGTTGGGFGDYLSDGTTLSSITLSLGSYQTYNNGGDGGQDPTVGGLMAPFILENTGTAITGTLNNVPTGIYDLYLYGMNYPDQDRGASFTVNGVTKSTLGINWNQMNHTSLQDSFVEGGSFNNAAADGSIGANAVAGANYVKFTVSPDANNQITFSVAANLFMRPTGLDDFSGQINGEGDFNGLQLVTVPEPSSYAMLALGMLALFGVTAVKRRARISQ